MKKLYIKETLNSPKILFDPVQKRYEISGKSFPENSAMFYQPAIDWMDKYALTHTDRMQLALIFDYISSSSVITLKQMLTKVKELLGKGANIEVLWYYKPTDADIKEIGEEYKKLVGINIKLVEKNF